MYARRIVRACAGPNRRLPRQKPTHRLKVHVRQCGGPYPALAVVALEHQDGMFAGMGTERGGPAWHVGRIGHRKLCPAQRLAIKMAAARARPATPEEIEAMFAKPVMREGAAFKPRTPNAMSGSNMGVFSPTARMTRSGLHARHAFGRWQLCSMRSVLSLIWPSKFPDIQSRIPCYRRSEFSRFDPEIPAFARVLR
jgi:hypothetical protein